MEFLRSTPKERIFIDSFGFNGFKEFIIQDDKKVINKSFYDLKMFNAKDQKIIIIMLMFSMTEFEKIKKLMLCII